VVDLREFDTAPHIADAFREEFPSWQDFRAFVASTARYPEFNERRALQQVLMVDLAQRIMSSNHHEWILIGSLALPARVPTALTWPDTFRASSIPDVEAAYVMPRSAFDLDLCAISVNDANPQVAADSYRREVLVALENVADPMAPSGNGRGIGLGGLIRYSYSPDDLRVYPNGQVMGIITAQPVDPRFGARYISAVDDSIAIEIDVKPPIKVTVTGSPDASERNIVGVDVPGFAPFLPMLNPTVNQLADKILIPTGKPQGLRNMPHGPWHRYKDVFDAYFMLQTSRVGADAMREAVTHTLARMGVQSAPIPYRVYGQDESGPEPVVPWKEGIEGLRKGSAQLQYYPSWEGMRTAISEFMESLPHAPKGSTWVPDRGWSNERAASLQTDAANARSTSVGPGNAPGRSVQQPGAQPKPFRAGPQSPTSSNRWGPSR
jgi:hypothetical protein